MRIVAQKVLISKLQQWLRLCDLLVFIVQEASTLAGENKQLFEDLLQQNDRRMEVFSKLTYLREFEGRASYKEVQSSFHVLSYPECSWYMDYWQLRMTVKPGDLL